jgi:hypothetical protein
VLAPGEASQGAHREGMDRMRPVGLVVSAGFQVCNRNLLAQQFLKTKQQIQDADGLCTQVIDRDSLRA